MNSLPKFSRVVIFRNHVLALLWAAILSASLFAQQSSAPQLTLLDPVPSLLKGPMVTGNVNTLASKGRAVQGVAADAVTEVVLRVPANSVGEQFTFTVYNDQGQQSTSSAEDGGLGVIGGSGFTQSQVTVSAVNTSKGPMAFAIYGVPIDFPGLRDRIRTRRSVSSRSTRWRSILGLLQTRL